LEPFYFGASERRLYGVYHLPRSEARDAGWVLCYPTGQEYMRCHRAFVHLAERLSHVGFHVLRFDLSGCGDSQGDANEADLPRWIEDVRTAVWELRQGSGVSRIGLCGLRLGGSIVALAASQSRDVDALILWDAVVNGSRYLAEIEAQHREWLAGSFAKPRSRVQTSDTREVLGHALTMSLVANLESLDLLQLASVPASRALLIDTRQDRVLPLLHESLRALGVDVEQRSIQAPPVWIKGAEVVGEPMVPVRVIDCVVDWGARCLP